MADQAEQERTAVPHPAGTGSAGDPPRPAPPPDRVRTPLLTLLTQESLDRDYQAAADARAARGQDAAGATDGAPGGAAGRSRHWVVVPVAVAFALLVTVAAVQTSRNADTVEASRAALIERIEGRRDVVSSRRAEAEQLRSDNAGAESVLRALGEDLAAAENRRLRLAADTGFVGVVGPGVRVVLDNTEQTAPENRVRDADLAMLVDALWAADAEAISINGHRLTARSGIRNSGVPIKVNGIGIAPPYTVLAIGDVDRLAADMVLTDPGQDFLALVNQFAFSYEIDNLDEMRLPAAPSRLLRLRSATDASDQVGRREGGTP